MPDTYSIKLQIYNISHANTNVDFVTKTDTSCAFIEVIFEGDAAVPELDFTAASLKTDVERFGKGE